jgi:hypothetical protein
MRKFLPYFFVLFSFHSFAQVSDTLLPNYSGQWSIKTWQYDGWSSSGGYYGWNGYSTYGYFNWNGTTWMSFGVNGGDGLMRSDSGKVYCRGWLDQLPLQGAPTDTSEKILYDFTMVIGDTAYFDEVIPVTVAGIGTSDILGITKKAWFLSNSDTIVQGLGSVMGLFRPWTSMFEAKNWICSFNGYYEDSLGTITNLSFTTDACELSFGEEDNFELKVNIGQDKIWVNSADQKDLFIYSVDGKLVYSLRISSGESTVHTDLLDQGVYVLKIENSYAQKFFKD